MNIIIVSNSKINKSGKQMSYNEFVSQAGSEEGLNFNRNDVFYINVSDLSQDIYADIKGADFIKFFTIDGIIPDFIDKEVETWSNNEKTDEEIAKDQTDDLTITNLLESNSNDNLNQDKDAKVYVFGSSKGGSGKTFTAIMSTYRYAKTHPNEKIALVDFDITDGQVSISIHTIKPTMEKYYIEYLSGKDDFNTMHQFAVKGNQKYPSNVDFYLAPPVANGRIKDDDFWMNIIKNCIENYDVVVFDTGIDYLGLSPISYAYKIADKILITTTTSIKSVNSVLQQIKNLTGENPNEVFSKEDDLAPHMNLIITQMVSTNKMNKTIYPTLNKACNVIATFGVLSDSINEAEYYGEWDIFDKRPNILQAFDKIMKLE